MGVTIRSENCSMDLGYSGFDRLRTKVAELTAPDIHKHYDYLRMGMFLTATEKEKFFEAYDAKIQRLSEKYNGEKDNILDFLYKSDCNGEIDKEHCSSIYEVIKNYDDNICYGYCGRPDCAMFKDFKELVKDCIDTNTSMRWC